MATFLQEASVAKPILFLYFLLNTLSANTVSAKLNSNKLVYKWNDPSQVSDVTAGSLFFAHVPSSVKLRSSEAGDIKLQDIPQVISLALGFTSLQNIEWRGLSAGNIFNRPKANILFIIDGISEENTDLFVRKSSTFKIVKNEANSNLDLLRISPMRNFISHISNILNNKPLVVSFSAEKQLAQSASTSGRNAHTVSWDSKDGAFKEEASSNGIKLSKDELLKMFKTADFGEGVKYFEKEQKFIVSARGMKDVSFDLTEMENFLFFAEVQTLFSLFEKVQKFDGLIRDDFTDFFTFGISTVKGLFHRYGNDSHQVVAALRIINNVLPRIAKLYDGLYGGQALIEVVYLENKEKAVEKAFQSEVKDESEEEDNEIHLRARRDIVGETRKATKCDNKENLAVVDDYYDNEFPPIFNIVLWLMIILVLTVYAVSIVMWYMDPGRDSIIYRVTSQRIKSE